MINSSKIIAKFNNYFLTSQEFRTIFLNTHRVDCSIVFNNYTDFDLSGQWIDLRAGFDFETIGEYLDYYDLKNISDLDDYALNSWNLSLHGRWKEIKTILDINQNLKFDIQNIIMNFEENKETLKNPNFHIFQDFYKYFEFCFDNDTKSYSEFNDFLFALIGRPKQTSWNDTSLSFFAYDYYCQLFNKKM